MLGQEIIDCCNTAIQTVTANTLAEMREQGIIAEDDQFFVEVTFGVDGTRATLHGSIRDLQTGESKTFDRKGSKQVGRVRKDRRPKSYANEAAKLSEQWVEFLKDRPRDIPLIIEITPNTPGQRGVANGRIYRWDGIQWRPEIIHQ